MTKSLWTHECLTCEVMIGKTRKLKDHKGHRLHKFPPLKDGPWTGAAADRFSKMFQMERK